ncbi:hypothetical protein R6Q57_011963 [Mikania cordata]
MAEKETSVVHNPDSQSIRNPNPISSIISKFTEVVNFRFPPPPVKKLEIERKAAGDTAIPGGGGLESGDCRSVDASGVRGGRGYQSCFSVAAKHSPSNESMTVPHIVWLWALA